MSDGERFLLILIFLGHWNMNNFNYLMLFFLQNFHTFNSYSPAEMPTVELQTKIVFIFFYKIQFSVSDNTVISFQRKNGTFYFFFYTCVWCLSYTQALRRRVKQSRRILSAQNNCKYLGPQLSHSFTTVESCQATKK